jgi:HEAT repeat protein
MRPALAVVLVLSAAPAGLAQDSGPAGLIHARLETRPVTGGLAREMRGLLASRADAFWVGYAVPAQGRHQMCCWSSTDEVENGCGGCRLEPDDDGRAFRHAGGRSPVQLEASPELRVLARAEGGRFGRLRTFSADCWLDAGDRPVVWLTGVRPAESVAWLATLVDEPLESEKKKAKGLGHAVLAAIAMHADPSADAVLEGWLKPDQPAERRRQAAFWMGNARGARGRDVLVRLLREDQDPRVREHVIFALTQNHEPGAIEAILEAARKDPSAHVRGQALFWLAQAASKRAPAAIKAAVDEDPEVEVKKKAVFALSQLPKDEGVPLLIGLARTHRSYEVRKQAMFWLGQSQDPRALAFFEEVLKP